MALPEHGANPLKLYKSLGVKPPAKVIDFSENVNPAGPPEAVTKMWGEFAQLLTAYPDPGGEPFLSAAANFHGIDKSSLFIGNGAAELLTLIANRYRGKRAIVVHPTFSEYEASLLAKNVEIIRVLSEEENGFKLPLEEIIDAMKSASVLYLCTPNNPTGTMPEQAELLRLIKCAAELKCEIILDEAFIDFVDESFSFIPEVAKFPHVTVIRSMTKMYAIPGIRLGYIVANPLVISEIKALAPHWNVNGIAARIGAICLQEEDFRERAINHSLQQRQKMMSFLRDNDCVVTDSVVNFVSFRLKQGRNSQNLYRDMLERGIVLRHTDNFRGMDGNWFRIGMKSEAMMAVLVEELTRWFAEN